MVTMEMGSLPRLNPTRGAHGQTFPVARRDQLDWPMCGENLQGLTAHRAGPGAGDCGGALPCHIDGFLSV